MNDLNLMSETIAQVNKMRIVDEDCSTIMYKLFDIGIVRKEWIQRFLIKKYYFDLLHDKNCSCRSALLDTAVKYDVSESFVSKCIYYYTDLKVF